MKKNLKKWAPNWVRAGLKKMIQNKVVKNYFNTNHDKKVLISYITTPFEKTSLSHTNYFEAVVVAEIFNVLGYQVDVVHYEYAFKKLGSYDVIYGFGETLEFFFEKKYTGKTKVIFYSTGMHLFLQNVNTLQRIRDVYNKKHSWLMNSSRLTNKSWFRQVVLSDAVIALGNDEVKQSFAPYYKGPIYQLNAPFYKVRSYQTFLNEKDKRAAKSYVWFGSSGLVHKGLDLCLEYFKQNKDLTLHVCGSLDHEADFVDTYRKELFDTDNIVTHGFVDINSPKFDVILKSSYFVIFPSCSEGGGVSVLTVIGNGAFVPLVTKESSITVPHAIPIDDFMFDSVQGAVAASQKIELNKLTSIAKENAEYVVEQNSLQTYKQKLKEIILCIIH